MAEQVVLVTLFLGLLAFVSLSCGMLLCALIQLVCFGFDFLSQKYSEIVSEFDNKLSKGEDK